MKQVNKKVVGKFKDEMNSIVLEEFVGLRPRFNWSATKKGWSETEVRLVWDRNKAGLRPKLGWSETEIKLVWDRNKNDLRPKSGRSDTEIKMV